MRYPQTPRHSAVTRFWLIGTLLLQASTDAQLIAKILEKYTIGGGSDARTKTEDLKAALGVNDATVPRLMKALHCPRPQGAIKTWEDGKPARGYWNIALKFPADGEAAGAAAAPPNQAAEETVPQVRGRALPGIRYVSPVLSPCPEIQATPRSRRSGGRRSTCLSR